MRKLLGFIVIIALGCCAFQIPMGSTWQGSASAPTIGPYCYNNNFTTSITCGSFAGGSLSIGQIFVAWGYAGTAVTMPASCTTVSSTGCVTGCGVTWTTAFEGSVSNGNAFFATATSTGTSCSSLPTWSGTGSSATIGIEVFAINGASTTVDGTPAVQDNNASSLFNGPSTTTSVANDMVLTFLLEESSVNTVTVGASSGTFTVSYNAGGGSGASVQTMAYQVKSSAGAINATYTPSGGPVHFETGIIAIEP